MTFVFCYFPSQAQFVTIPDSNFRSYLAQHFPNAMIGNTLDTTHIDITSAVSVDCSRRNIRNLNGIQYFDNLINLDCSQNLITLIPSFPATLNSIHCHTNMMDTLPALPLNLTALNCAQCNLTSLPILPASITNLSCNVNKLVSLPSLPTNLLFLDCSYNKLQQLPVLPSSLANLNCYYNKLTSLPALPNSLVDLTSSFNPLPVLPNLPSSLTILNCDHDSLTQLPALPASLAQLNCSSNYLTQLPVLPSVLSKLECQTNLLPQLPTLPNSLTHINATNNVLTSLPTLPTNLLNLYVGDNQLTVLPTLPATLVRLNVSRNGIPQLPTLPMSLLYLNYSDNPIGSLPTLPTALYELVWDQNSTPILPILPNSLVILQCNSTDIDSLPSLPAGLQVLYCEADSLTFLPPLPAGLQVLDFAHNQLSSMPIDLPTQLNYLNMAKNYISTIPWLPLTLQQFNCSGNTSLNCLPKLPNEMHWIHFDMTGIMCLPNYLRVIDTLNTGANFFTTPLCTLASGCPCAWNITGNVHADTSINCIQDNLFPGNRVTNVKLNLTRNNLFLEQAYVTGQGEYSFDTGDTDSLEVSLDTTDLPFTVTCPTNGVQQVVLIPADSMKDKIHFGVECSGNDGGVKSIMGRFRPGVISSVQIKAGDMAAFYNVHCGNPYSGTVTLTFDGPVSYVSPAVNAMSPSTINNNVLTYNVADMTQIDFNTAFGIELQTDIAAVLGTEVCISLQVDNVLNDIHPNNNYLNMCFPVVNSFDPNEKQVSPLDFVSAGQWLTYTIHFQNTGNDTAYRVVIRDTLQPALDPTSFQMIAASHKVIPSVVQNQIAFYFNEINLVDSVHNEPESHGWVQFKVKIKNDLPIGTEINNRASIYFDYNSAIVTNDATNHIGTDLRYEVGERPFIVPDAITPNDDGRNESWHILNLRKMEERDVRIKRIVIYNRWGQKVSEATSGDYFNWHPYMTTTDVYAYVIVYSVHSGTEYTQTGNITVIK